MKKITTILFLAVLTCSAFAGKPSLKDAIAKQDINKVKELLNNGADVNETWSGAPALYWAAWRGNCDMIKLLVENGAEVDKLSTQGNTPLACVVSLAENPSTVIAANIKLNKKAIKRFGEEKCKAKGWLACTDSSKFSTSEEKAKTLIELGADPNFALGTGAVKVGTPFLSAVKDQNLSLVKVMLDTKKVDTEKRFNKFAEKVLGNQNSTPLIYAIEKQNLALVKLLVEGGADVNNGKDVIEKTSTYNENSVTIIKKTHWITPLAIATEKGNAEIISYLKENGAVLTQE